MKKGNAKISRKERKMLKKAFNKTMKEYRSVFVKLQNS
jgi:cobalamin biosynthesis protein CbiD